MGARDGVRDGPAAVLAADEADLKRVRALLEGAWSSCVNWR